MEKSLNYHQVIEQTPEEQKRIYTSIDKEVIIDMLIECNKIIASMVNLPIVQNSPTVVEYRDFHNCENWLTPICKKSETDICPCHAWRRSSNTSCSAELAAGEPYSKLTTSSVDER